MSLFCFIILHGSGKSKMESGEINGTEKRRVLSVKLRRRTRRMDYPLILNPFPVNSSSVFERIQVLPLLGEPW